MANRYHPNITKTLHLMMRFKLALSHLLLPRYVPQYPGDNVEYLLLNCYAGVANGRSVSASKLS